MPLERSTFQWGGTVFPLTTSGSNSSLQDVDPALFYALDYWSAMLTTYAGARYTAEATAAGLKTPERPIVAMTVPYDPGPYLASDQLKFPLLAAYRSRSKATEQSVQWERSDSIWTIAWVLPPLEPEQAERLIVFMDGAVLPILVNRTTEGVDATYTPPGSTLGAPVWALTGVQEIGIVDASFGDWQTATGLRFPAAQMTCRVTERQAVPTGAFDLYSGADVQVDVQPNEGGSPVTHVADFKDK